MMSKTFGAPFGAVTSRGKSGVDSLAFRPMTPLNCGCGTGRTAEPPDGSVLWSGVDGCSAKAGKHPTRNVTTNQQALTNERGCFESESARVANGGTTVMTSSSADVILSPFTYIELWVPLGSTMCKGCSARPEVRNGPLGGRSWKGQIATMPTST